jgi:hypothetical protein
LFVTTSWNYCCGGLWKRTAKGGRKHSGCPRFLSLEDYSVAIDNPKEAFEQQYMREEEKTLWK